MKALLAFQLIGFYGVYAICFWVGLVFALILGALSGVFPGIHAEVSQYIPNQAPPPPVVNPKPAGQPAAGSTKKRDTGPFR